MSCHPPSPAKQNLRTVLRSLAAVGFVLAGANHFRNPKFYQQIVPPGFPSPAALVAISGIAEIAGGIGLLIRPVRRVAGWGLIAMLVAVFPANIYMAIARDRIPAAAGFPRWELWLRLPLQPLMMWWIWWVMPTNAP